MGDRVLSDARDPQSTQESDGQLLQRIAAGDLVAFRCLYDRYRPVLHRFLRRYNPRDALIEEIVNDTLYAVWCSASGFRGESRPSTWIHGIAYRQCMKRFERQDLLVDGPQFEEQAVASGEEDTIREDWLKAALDELPGEQRTVVELTYFQGNSCQEIAEKVGCPVNTVKTRMFHARRKLRQRLLQLAGEAP